MSWFNGYGLAIMALIMIPNVIFSLRHGEEFTNRFDCKCLEIAEQIGRYGSFVLMIFNIPHTYFGWVCAFAEPIYLIVNGVLIAVYEAVWIAMRDKNNLARALLLSVIPSVIFIFSGIMITSVPLIAFAVLFAACHITISVKNATARGDKT